MKKENVIKELNKAHPKSDSVMFLDDNGTLHNIHLDYLCILGQPDYSTIIIEKDN